MSFSWNFDEHQTQIPQPGRSSWDVSDCARLGGPGDIEPGDIYFWEKKVERSSDRFYHPHVGICVGKPTHSTHTFSHPTYYGANDTVDLPIVSVVPSIECFLEGCGRKNTIIFPTKFFAGLDDKAVFLGAKQSRLRVLRIKDPVVKRNFVAALNKFKNAVENKVDEAQNSVDHAEYNAELTNGNPLIQIPKAVTFGLLQTFRCPAKKTDREFEDSVLGILKKDVNGKGGGFVYALDTLTRFFCSYYAVSVLQGLLYLVFDKSRGGEKNPFMEVYAYAPLVAKQCSPSSVFWVLRSTGMYDCYVLNHYSYTSNPDTLITFDPRFSTNSLCLDKARIESLAYVIVNSSTNKKYDYVTVFSELCMWARHNARTGGKRVWGTIVPVSGPGSESGALKEIKNYVVQHFRHRAPPEKVKKLLEQFISTYDDNDIARDTGIPSELAKRTWTDTLYDEINYLFTSKPREVLPPRQKGG